MSEEEILRAKMREVEAEIEQFRAEERKQEELYTQAYKKIVLWFFGRKDYEHHLSLARQAQWDKKAKRKGT